MTGGCAQFMTEPMEHNSDAETAPVPVAANAKQVIIIKKAQISYNHCLNMLYQPAKNCMADNHFKAPLLVWTFLEEDQIELDAGSNLEQC